jgi:hypothetical protein
MMEEVSTSETLVNFYQTTRRYNLEDSHLLSVPCSQNNAVLSCHQLDHVNNFWGFFRCVLVEISSFLLWGGGCGVRRNAQKLRVLGEIQQERPQRSSIHFKIHRKRCTRNFILIHIYTEVCINLKCAATKVQWRVYMNLKWTFGFYKNCRFVSRLNSCSRTKLCRAVYFVMFSYYGLKR